MTAEPRYPWLAPLLILIGLILLVCFLVQYVSARETYPGQYAQVDPELRKWFRNQVSPATGTSCCSEADGTYVEEDIREGHYWIRFDKTEGKWMPVPDEIVIHDPNRNGAPVVWWYYDSDQAMIGFRCYAPGGGV
jgi:hypothetical protein